MHCPEKRKKGFVVHGIGNSVNTFGAVNKFQKANTQAFKQMYKHSNNHASIQLTSQAQMHMVNFDAKVLENIFF